MRAQMQLVETVAVLVIFFFLIVIGLSFYTFVVKGDVVRERAEQVEETAIKIASRALDLSELQCSQYDVVREGCVDRVKLEIAPSLFALHPVRYFGLLGFSKIEVKQIYPDARSWTVYNTTKVNASMQTVLHLPVSVWDPVVDTYGFGYIRVEAFS